MSDLVKRLRDYASNLGGNPEDYLTWQAADRIAALEAALRDIMNHPEEERRTGEPSYSVKWAFWNIQNIARAALEGK